MTSRAGFQLDHVFLGTTAPQAVEAELSDFGIAFTLRREHPGQGTANACASFENAYFELLHARDPAELRSTLVAPLGLDERIHFAESGACPVGLCFRATSGSEATPLPFETWDHKPSYLPPNGRLPVVTPRHSVFEPLVFLSPWPPRDSTSVLHRGRARTLTSVGVQCPESVTISPAVAWFVDNGLFVLRRGPAYQLELEWDHGQEGGVLSLRHAPLVLRW